MDEHGETTDAGVTGSFSGSPSGSTTQQLLDLIWSGSLSPGDRLPAERSLAEQLLVGRSAVREAIAALEVLGFVETRGGSGTYLRAATSELLPRALNWGMMLDRDKTAQLAQVREGLEILAVELAAPAYRATRLAELAAIVDEAAALRFDPAGFVEVDVAFHRHIADTSGNPTLADLLSTARSLLRVWFEKAVREQTDIEAALREHGAIVTALAAGDVLGAVAAMRVHMRTATERILRAG